MIALFLGTSESRKILHYLNKVTDNIYVSTATKYGGEIIKNYKYKYINTTPLTEIDMEKLVDKYKISLIIDASHPYATGVTENIMSICNKKEIPYIRYERSSVIEKYTSNPNVIQVNNYDELESQLKSIDGTIINTTGSNNIEKFMQMNIANKIVHKVLPIKEVFIKLSYLQVPIENIVAVYGGGSKNFNKALFQEYAASAVILKDSGKEGKTEEKIQAALDLEMQVFVIKRKQIAYENVYQDEIELTEHIKKHFLSSYTD